MIGTGSGVADATQGLRVRVSANSARAFSGKSNIAFGAGKTIAATAALPSAVGKATKDIGRAIQTGRAEDINQAVISGTGAGTTALNAANGALQTANVANTYGKAYKAAKAAGASGTVARAAANAATHSALGGASRQVVRGAARKLAGTAARETLTRTAARAAGKAAGNAAGKAATRAAAGALGKAAGRFAPGVNIAIAGLDAAQAVAIQRDPDASTAKKAAGWVTAGASAVAATNIPIVSQVGAGVSAVSGFLRDLW